jgi:ATP-dependent RNA helicase HelY
MAEPVLSPADRYAAAAERSSYPDMTEFRAHLPFTLDTFQADACRALEDGMSVLVCAPTGAGKTVVGEFAVARALAAGTKCFYTTPIKALSNQKYADFAETYGAESVGLVTGDTSINPHAPVLVMTTEVLRNMLYAGSPDLDGLSAVVLDEIHYLANRFRGAVWEEVILHLPRPIALVGLSATVSNAEEFGDWIRSVRGPTAVIVDEERPVPLWQHVMVAGRLFDLYAQTGRRRTLDPALHRAIAQIRPPMPERGKRGLRGQPHGPRQWRRTPRSVVVERLDATGLLPAIFFVFSRAGCDAAADQCVRAGLRLTSPAEAAEIARIVDEHTADLPAADLRTLDYWTWRSAWERGVAAHHAGLLPAFKETVEDLFARGLIKVVFATETLALGINMPARTVVLDRLVKYDGEQHTEVTPGEYTQLTGRAGRRGIDVEGHAVVLWSPEIDPMTVAGLASTRTFPLKSSFRPTYNMVVNMVDQRGRAASLELLERSFAQFQADRSMAGAARELAADEARWTEVDREMRCARGDVRQYVELLARLSATEKAGRRGGPDPNRRAADIRALRAAVHAHPVHSCPDRSEHLHRAHRARRLARRVEALRGRIDRARNSLGQGLERISDLLTERGYLRGDRATDIGRTLGRIWFDADLLASECVRAGLWRGLTAPELAGAVSGLVFESRREAALPARSLSGAPRGAGLATEDLWHDITADEQRFGVRATRRPDFGFAACVAHWARGASLADALAVADDVGTELSAGDFVRWCRQVVDALDQLWHAAPVDTAPNAGAAIAAIRRGVVALGTD